jgi:hypothetical protein
LGFLFSSRLPGGGITFFAAAKKVIKESSFSNQRVGAVLVIWIKLFRRQSVASALIGLTGLGTHAD